MTAQTASGTAVNFTSIPSWVKRITITFESVFFSSGDDIMVQIGPSGGVETTNYTYTDVSANGGSTIKSIIGAGFVLTGGQAAASSVQGILYITTVSGNVWVSSANIGGVTFNNVGVHTGRKSLAGVLTQLSVKGVLGQTFGGGTIQVFYE